MIDAFTPPFSGVVVSHIIDALNLRRWDTGGVLSQRNSLRYLAGDRVGQQAEARVMEAVAHALLASRLLPEGLSLTGALPYLPHDDPGAEWLRSLPPNRTLAIVLGLYAAHWDAIAGALRRQTPAIAHVRVAAGACLRLVVVDLIVRLTALLWLMRWKSETPFLTFWANKGGVGMWLRSLLRRCEPSTSRDALAEALRVHRRTVDGWLDTDARPTDENLEDLAGFLADHGLGVRDELLHRIRLAYAMRALYEKVEDAVGEDQAIGMAVRLMRLGPALLVFRRRSEQSVEENDLKMRLLLVQGTLPSPAGRLPWVEYMLRSIWRGEPDPVWRTTLKAATRSWFEHLQEAMAKLGPTNVDEFRRMTGCDPKPELLEQLAYGCLASKEELARSPLVRAAMDSEIDEGGRPAAVELKLRASELAWRGDLVRAADLVREALRHDPLDADGHFRLGAFLWQIADVDNAFTELEIAVRLAPEWDRPRVEIAILLLNLNRDREALDRLEAARRELPTASDWLLLNLGGAYERVGDIAGAIRTFEELLAIDPREAEALDHLAHLYFVSGDRRKGADCAKRAAHFGFTTVFDAYTSNYYEGGGVKPRPPHTVPPEFVHLADAPGRLSKLEL